MDKCKLMNVMTVAQIIFHYFECMWINIWIDIFFLELLFILVTPSLEKNKSTLSFLYKCYICEKDKWVCIIFNYQIKKNL